MSLHMIKLCVGADSVDDLKEWVADRAMTAIAAGLEPHSVHTTRMVPKKADEILDGGSLYWVIKGQVLARQMIIGIETFTDVDGIGRCRLMLGPEVIETAPQPRRAFQGWRYLRPEDAPPDLKGIGGADVDMPADLARELSELGLL
ncbi:DUF1489 family protein [Rhizobium sp. NRK18]|uniref:DUF1489 family protein n=1 Tax=Rhizobium sp. NRK18 TaxID=2964667 RepID=UPI0021C2D008|nr:DUF1489 family protein [Rhizobium sp. NRK18]MCQ2004218.1 DUF1489 family protein [Rhizobium sp. NRK18]